MGELPNQQPINQDVQPPDGWPDNISAQLGENVIPTPDDINGGVTAETQIAGPTHKEIHAGSAESTEATEQQPENPAGIETAYPSESEIAVPEKPQPEVAEPTNVPEVASASPEVTVEPIEFNVQPEHSAGENDNTDSLQPSPMNEFTRRKQEPDMNEGRWDERKARTMASVVYNDRPDTAGSTANLLDKQQETIDHSVNADGTPNTEYEDEPTKRARASLERAKEDLAAATENGDEAGIEKGTKKVKEFQEIYDVQKKGQAKSLNKEANIIGEQIDKVSDELLQPFEELYDSNPDKYANMLTSEFVELVKEFTGIDKTIENRNRASDNLQQFEEFIRTAVKYERPYGTGRFDAPEARDHLKKRVLQALEGASEEVQRAGEEFDDILKDGYDKTPRQINDGLLSFVDATIAKAKKLNEADQQRRLVMLGKAEPAETTNSDS